MTVQQIGFIPESSMAQETVATPDQGQDIFSALLLLALSGNGSGSLDLPAEMEEGSACVEPFGYAQGKLREKNPDSPAPSLENIGSVPAFFVPSGILATPDKTVSLPEEGGDNPPSSLLIPSFPAGEKEMEKSPAGPLESEFLQGAQVLEDAAVSDEKPDLSALGTGASSKKTGDALAGTAGRPSLPVDIAPVDSVSPAMTPPPVIVRGEVPEQTPISHVINEPAFLHETSMSQGLTKGDENRREQEMRVPDFSLDRGLRLKPDTQQGFSDEINKVTGLFQDGDQRNNFSMDSDAREDRRWIGVAEMITSVKKPPSTGNDTQLQPLYKYIEPEKVMHQLTQRLIHASHIGSHTARIRLKPEELGELSVDISVMDNSVKAVITVDSYDVKEVIEANLHKLDEELRNHGLRIEEFTVEMRGGSPEDRFTSAHGREERISGKRNERMAVDNRLDQEDLSIPIAMDRGFVSIFV